METHRTKGDIIYLEPVICWVSAAARDGHTAHACQWTKQLFSFLPLSTDFNHF